MRVLGGSAKHFEDYLIKAACKWQEEQAILNVLNGLEVIEQNSGEDDLAEKGFDAWCKWGEIDSDKYRLLNILSKLINKLIHYGC